MSERSYGILLRVADKFLIGHAANGDGKPKGGREWTVFKGRPDEGETEMETAFREFREETGYNVEKTVQELGIRPQLLPTFTTPQGKVVTVFLYDFTPFPFILSETFKCVSMVTDKGTNPFPEIDEYKWATIEEARKVVFSSQKPLFESVRRLVM